MFVCLSVNVRPYVGADEALWGESVKPAGESGFCVCVSVCQTVRQTQKLVTREHAGE